MIAAVVVGVAMFIFGVLTTSLLHRSVLRIAGEDWAPFLEAFLEPHVRHLDGGATLPPARLASLDSVFANGRRNHTLVAVRIWSTDGDLLYAAGGHAVGEDRSSEALATAASGEKVVQIDRSAAGGDPLVEIYAPLYGLGGEDVVAVGVLHASASTLVGELDAVRLVTWGAVAATSILVTGVLYLIVWSAARTIDRQQSDLRTRVEESGLLAAQNNELRLAADKTRLDASEANEQLLGRIGADLHDGPIQLLSLLTLSLTSRLGAASRAAGEGGEPDELRILRTALSELRNISAGLSLPEIRRTGLRKALELAVFRHEDLTGDHVVAKWGRLPKHASEALKICAYRVLQEGMTNAHKHAHGAQIEVSARCEGDLVRLEVADTGGSEQDEASVVETNKLGLAGMRKRVISLNGTLEVSAREPRGTRVVAYLPLRPMAVSPEGTGLAAPRSPVRRGSEH